MDFTQPFYLRGAADDPRAVLLLHGFTGSPYELHLLAQSLHRLGYHCAVPRLAGHHDTLKALAATGFPDWLASADRALHELWAERAAALPQGISPRLAVIGLSMGGLLTLELARRYGETATTSHAPQIRTFSTLSSPLFLPARQTRAIRALGRRPLLRRLAVPKIFGADVRERNLRPPPLRPRGMPISCLNSLLDLMSEVREHLAEVRQPALLCHGMRDHTAPFASMAAIAQGLGTSPTALRCVALPRSYHLIPIDVEREVVFAEMAQHLSRHLG